MENRRLRTFQALILALTGFFIIWQVWSGDILTAANPRFVLLVLAAGIALLALAQVIFQERMKAEKSAQDPAAGSRRTSLAGLAWLALPLALGALAPVRPLGTNALAMRGISTSATFSLQGAAGAAALQRPPAQRNVLDWVRAFQAGPNPDALEGEEVDLIGFVYHDPRLSAGQFMVSRYVKACCVAQAAGIGIVVNWGAAPGLKDDDWVRVQGKLSNGQLDGVAAPVIEAGQVTPIPAPEQPYLSP